MVKKSKGRNTKALRGAELREIEVNPCSSGENNCSSLLGELVEVRHRGAGFRGSWHPARVVKVDAGQSLVEYEKLFSRDGELKFQEYVPLSEEGSRILLRPRPPPFVSSEEALQRGVWVEAFYGDAWWEGVLMDDVSESMQVFFPDEGDRRSFCMANLRVSQEWDNKTGAWTMKGKWTEFASIEGRKFRLKRTFAVQPKVPVEKKADSPEEAAGDEPQKLPSEAADENSDKLHETGDESLKRKRGEGRGEGDSDDESLVHWLERHKKKLREDGGVEGGGEACGRSSASAPVEEEDEACGKSSASAPAVAGSLDSGEAPAEGPAAGVWSLLNPGTSAPAAGIWISSGNIAPVEEPAAGVWSLVSRNSAPVEEAGGEQKTVGAPSALDDADSAPEERFCRVSVALDDGSSGVVVTSLDSTPAAGAPSLDSTPPSAKAPSLDSTPAEEAAGGTLMSLDTAPAREEEAAGGTLTTLDPAPVGEEEAAAGALRSSWDQNLEPSFDPESSNDEKEPSPEAKSNVTNDPQLEQLQCQENLDAAMGDLQEVQEAEKTGLLFYQLLGATSDTQAPLQAPVASHDGKLKLARKLVVKRPASRSGESLSKNLSSASRNGESSASRSSSSFTAALNKTKKLLLDSGWSLRRSLRERFSRSAPELLCVSPEGRPFVSLASACREWIRRNKHRKLAHVQIVARGENLGPCEFLAHNPPGELGQASSSSTPRARRTREEIAMAVEEAQRNKKLKTKGETTEKKKRGRPRAGCRLEAATPARARQEEDEEARLSKKLTLFSWLLEMGVVVEDARIQCEKKSEKNELLSGVISGDGIVCGCCRKSFSVSGFQSHASSASGSGLRLEDGRSILDCKLAALRAMKAKESEVLAENEAIEVDENDDTCAVCGNGGQLVCCDHCPSTYHLKCVQLEKVPDGDWFCPRCCCASCGSNLYNPENQADILYCDQCEREYHSNCLNGEGMKYNSADNKFCSRKCLKIFRGLRRLVGRSNAMDEGFTWTLLRSSELPQQNKLDLEAVAENSTRLALALTLIQECFRPMIDFRTKTNIVTHILFNQRGDEKRLDFRGFYTLVLERDGEMISVASIRIHGAHAAEIPFIGTRAQYRRQGMCRRLISITEQILQALEVQTLVLPAIAEFAETWIGAFGFQRLTPAQGVQLMELNIVTFPGTSILYKPLTWLSCGRKPPPAEERLYLSLLQDEDSDDEKQQEKTPEKPQSPETDDEPPELKLPKKKASSKGKNPASKKLKPVDESPPEIPAPVAGDELQKLSKPRAPVAKARSNNRVVKSPTWKSRFLKLPEEEEEAPKAITTTATTIISPGASSDGNTRLLSEEDGEPKLSPTPRTFSRRRSKAERNPKDARIAGPLASSQAGYLGIPKWPTNKRSKRARPVFKSHAAVASRRAAPKKSSKRS